MWFWRCWYSAFGRRWRLWTTVILTMLASTFEIGKLAGSYPDNRFFQLVQHSLSESAFLFWLGFLSTPLVPAVVAVSFLAKEKVANAAELSQDELISLLAAIDSVVGKKAKRFATKLQQCQEAGGWTKQTTFGRITQPRDQYEAIVEAIWLHFSTVFRASKIQFHVVLARMGPHHIEKVVTCAPPAKPLFIEKLEDLQHADSGFSRAKAEGKLIVVSDIAKESQKDIHVRRYRPIPSETSKGALICFPVRHLGGQEIPFVLSIKASEAHLFIEGEPERQRYTDTLAIFETRISLEYSLEKLKSLSR